MNTRKIATGLTVVLVTASAASWSQPPENRNGIADTPGTGRFAPLKEIDAGLPDQVVYRPADLAALGDTKLGLYVFGNGGCSNDGASARSPPPECRLARLPRDRAWWHLQRSRQDRSAATARGHEHRELCADASRPTQRRDRLGTRGEQALRQPLLRPDRSRADRDLRFQLWRRSGVDDRGRPAREDRRHHEQRPLRRRRDPHGRHGRDESRIKDLHTPTLYVLGGPKDIAYANGMDDYAKINHVPIAVANIDKGHGGTYWEPNGGVAAEVVIDWLDWQLRGSAEASHAFVGPNCGLCRDAKWDTRARGSS